jgi:hypothetical protein
VQIQPMLAWVEHISPARAAAIARGADLTRTDHLAYAESPRRGTGQKVVATFTSTSRGGSATVELDTDRLGRPGASCDCDGPAGCEHIAALVGDLAVSRALRAAVARGEVTDGLVAKRPALGEEGRATLAALVLVEPWCDSPVETTLSMAPVSVNVDPSGPTVEIAFKTADRRAVDPGSLPLELLPDAYRRLLFVARPDASGKTFVARGPDASTLIELLRAVSLIRSGERSPVVFALDSARLRLVRMRLSREDAIARGVESAKGRRRTSLRDTVDVLEARWFTGDGVLDLAADEAVVIAGPFPHLWIPGRGVFHAIARDVDLAFAARVERSPRIVLPPGESPGIYRVLRGSLARGSVELPPSESMGLAPREVPRLVVRVEGKPLDVRATLEARYGFGTYRLGLASSEDVEADRRDDDVERAALHQVSLTGLAWDAELELFRARDGAAATFFRDGLDRLRLGSDPALEVILAKDLAKVRVRASARASLSGSLRAGRLDVELTVGSEDVSVDPVALQEALVGARDWLVLADGSIAELTPRARSLALEVRDALEEARGQLTPAALGLMSRWIELADDTAGLAEDVRGWLGRLVQPRAEDAKLPKGLAISLSSYQRAALAWLEALAELGLGGAFADDAGLGKTAVVVALLAWCDQHEGAAPSVVVCPPVFAAHWAEEARRVAPGLRVVLLSGTTATDGDLRIDEADLVITTYARLAGDVDALGEHSFRYVILDEVEQYRGAGEARSAARRLGAERRLVLDSAPIEANVSELFRLLDFANPGMLGPAAAFARRVEHAIELEPHGRAAAELRSRIAPFVLRRRFATLSAEAPAFQLLELRCPPTTTKRRRYDLVARDVRKDVNAKGAARGEVVLEAVRKLREVCVDPRQVGPSQRGVGAGRRGVMFALLRDLVSAGRRVAVAASGTLSARVTECLVEDGLPCELAAGTAREREAVVKRFRRGDAALLVASPEVIATLGSDLDVVVEADPWSTLPSSGEGVFVPRIVYRLYIAGTVEERMAVWLRTGSPFAAPFLDADPAAVAALDDSALAGLFDAIPNDVEPIDETEPDEDDDEPRSTKVISLLPEGSSAPTKPPPSEPPVVEEAPAEEPSEPEPAPAPKRAPRAKRAESKPAPPASPPPPPPPAPAAKSARKAPVAAASGDPMWEASEEEQDALREVTKAWLDQDGHSQRALATALGVAPTKLSTFLAGWGRLRTSEAIALHGAVSE